jgi:DNA mismatch endonuclease, patch repair protein
MPYSFVTTTRRSRNMRAIKASSNATTEQRFRAYLIRKGIAGWKVQAKSVPGCPDFFFSTERIAVFVDGCFWHSCPKCGHTPKTNRTYWRRKLARNKQRDARIKRTLRSNGIRVLRLWECQLRDKPNSCLKRLFTLLGRTPAAPST